MTEHSAAVEHHGPKLQVYYVVFGALCIFTAVSFFVNLHYGVGSYTGMAIIMGVAVCKATLVCMFFMHLKYEWNKLYFLIIPVGILAVMMVIVFMPDGVVGWHHDAADAAAAAAIKNK